MHRVSAKESEIQKSILDYLHLKKVFCYKQNTAGIYRKDTGSYIPSQSVGAPDIICIIKGRYVGLEVKREKGILSEHQTAFKKAVESAGGVYAVVRSIDDTIEALGSS